jgi:hypothetical protein
LRRHPARPFLGRFHDGVQPARCDPQGSFERELANAFLVTLRHRHLGAFLSVALLTACGGAANDLTAPFSATSTALAGKEQVLYKFAGGTDGAVSYSNLLLI